MVADQEPILHIPWVDIETTGLDADEDFVLEVALVITDLNLDLVNTTSAVLSVPQAAFQRMRSSEIVWNMHTGNGLIEALMSGDGTYMDEADLDFCDVMEKYFGTARPPMAGSSVHFDREFLRRSLPAFTSKFSYRNMDVSSVKEMAQRWAPTVWAQRPGQNDADKHHRAIDDALASIDELRHYLETGFISRLDPTQED